MSLIEQAQAALKRAITASLTACGALLVMCVAVFYMPFDCPNGPFWTLVMLVIVMLVVANAIYRLHQSVVINENLW